MVFLKIKIKTTMKPKGLNFYWSKEVTEWWVSRVVLELDLVGWDCLNELLFLS